VVLGSCGLCSVSETRISFPKQPTLFLSARSTGTLEYSLLKLIAEQEKATMRKNNAIVLFWIESLRRVLGEFKVWLPGRSTRGRVNVMCKQRAHTKVFQFSPPVETSSPTIHCQSTARRPPTAFSPLRKRMDLLSPSRLLDKSPLKDVTNSTPTPGIGGSPRKIAKLTTRSKRSNSTTTTTTVSTQSPQRRSTRLNSSKVVDLNDKAEKGEVPQSGTTTRSRRSKITPKAGEGVTIRKRGGRREPSEGSVPTAGRRTRRSISAVPSSPLAGKENIHENLSTPKRPRMTRSMSMSAKTEASISSSDKQRIPVINETDNESHQR